jgi:hypothetical protein
LASNNIGQQLQGIRFLPKISSKELEMKTLNHIWRLSILGILLFCSLTTSAQWKKKTYTQWSQEDARKVLEDSPWVKRTEQFYRSESDPLKPDTDPSIGSAKNRQSGPDPLHPDTTTSTGAPRNPRTNPPGVIRPISGKTVMIYVRLVSAKPVLEALKKANVDNSEELARQIESLNSPDERYIIISVASDHLLFKLTEEGASQSFLEVNKQRIHPKSHFDLKAPPGSNIPGATYIKLNKIFVFPRIVGGKPLISQDSEIRFHTSVQGELRVKKGGRVDIDIQIKEIDVKFKAKDLLFDGAVQY